MFCKERIGLIVEGSRTKIVADDQNDQDFVLVFQFLKFTSNYDTAENVNFFLI